MAHTSIVFATISDTRQAVHGLRWDALAYAAHLDRVADLHLSEGRGALADQLAHRAQEIA